MFEDKVLVYSTLSISTIASVANITLLFGIICFEKNHYYRTLINQLVTSMYWYGILWIICIQIPTTVRYLVASFPPILCSLDVILRNVFMMQVLFFLDAVLLCRYIFIFHLKNPTALQEDFWKLYINLLTILFSFIAQFYQFMLPGKQPNIYYICLGTFPNNLISTPTKPNSPAIYQFLVSFVFYACASIRIKIHSKKENANQMIQTATISLQQAWINTQTLENFVINVIHLWVMLSGFLVTVVINKLRLDELDFYPNYFWIYATHHYVPISMTFTMMALNYGKNKLLIKFLFSEFLQF